jgi:PAS domain S-box-containing protein
LFEFFHKLFETDFMPHVYCLRQPDVIWLHVASDALIAASYFLIPFFLVRIVRRRRDVAFSWMFVLFGAFILSCGLTHLLAIVTLWHPMYRLEGIVKAITAVASLPTALLLIRLTPQVVALPSPQQLHVQILERKRAEAEVRQLNRDLEKRIAERTKALEKANRQLAHSEQRTREILDSSPAVIYIKDCDGRMEFINRQFEQVFDVRRNEVLGKSDKELFHPEMAAAYRENDVAVQQQGPRQVEELAMHRDSLHTYLSVKFPLLDLDGEPYGICGISTDITEQKKTEAALRRSNAELREFAYAAAHDLQEPLRNVSTLLGLLRRRYNDQLPHDAQTWIGESVTAAQHMHRMVKDLLHLTEVVEGAQSPNAPVDANQVAQQALANLHSTVAATGAEIIFHPLPQVKVDGTHLLQLLQNLLGNALKYHHPQRRPAIVLSAAKRGNEWLFSLADNGIGFDPAYAKRIFGVFKRLHARHEYEGSGMGLAICARIVAHYHGRMWAEAQPDVGATFWFTLPVAESAS